MNNFVILSGCSGGGKSTLLEALGKRGYCVVEEPGRRIVSEQLASGGSALPWDNMQGFAQRAIELSLNDRAQMHSATDWVFFDRGLIDALFALDSCTAYSSIEQVAAKNRFHHKVFLTPPWPEIFVTDNERRQHMSESVEEYKRLLSGYPKVGYEPIILPKVAVEDRVNFLLRELARE